MKPGFVIVITVASLLSALIFGGCSTDTLGESVTHLDTRVIATINFGKELIFDEIVEVPVGSSAMTAIKQVLEVETAYGGGFVSGINGVSSMRTNRDWLVYINGIQPNVGALDYTLSDGDIQQWDFHYWRFRIMTPAIIGAFPEPFLNGYEGKVYPTVIVYQAGLENNADKLMDILRGLGVDDVTSVNVDNLSDDIKQSANLILLCTADNELISELDEAWNRLGFFIRFENGKIAVYNSKGDVFQRYGAGTGLIQATRNPWNPRGIVVCENVVWMLSGIDEEGVRNAADSLANGYGQYRHSFAVIVTADGSIVKVPP